MRSAKGEKKRIFSLTFVLCCCPLFLHLTISNKIINSRSHLYCFQYKCERLQNVNDFSSSGYRYIAKLVGRNMTNVHPWHRQVWLKINKAFIRTRKPGQHNAFLVHPWYSDALGLIIILGFIMQWLSNVSIILQVSFNLKHLTDIAI